MPHLPWLILSNGDGNDNLTSKTPEHPFNVDWTLVPFLTIKSTNKVYRTRVLFWWRCQGKSVNCDAIRWRFQASGPRRAPCVASLYKLLQPGFDLPAGTNRLAHSECVNVTFPTSAFTPKEIKRRSSEKNVSSGVRGRGKPLAFARCTADALRSRMPGTSEQKSLAGD